MIPKLPGNACHTFLAVSGSATRTELAWNPVLQADSFDLVRGDVGHLRMNGGTVDLGPVTCLAQRVSLPSVSDRDIPQPGQAFFYVTRYRRGGTLSEYGWASTDEPRRAGNGDCAK